MPEKFASALIISAVVSFLIAVPLSLAIVRLYARSVLRGMRSGGRPDGAPAKDLSVSAQRKRSAARLEVLSVDSLERSVTEPSRARRRRQISVATVYACAGVVYGIVITAVVAQIDEPFTLRQSFSFALLMAWPVVPTVMEALVGDRKTKLIGVGVLTAIAYVLNPVAKAELWVPLIIMVGIPATAALAISNRRIRQVGPIVLASVLLPVSGVSLALNALAYAPEGTFPMGQAGLFVLAGALATPVSLVGLRHAFERKAISDQMLLIDVWWFLFTGWEVVLRGHLGVAALWVSAAYAAYFVVVRVGLSVVRRVLPAMEPKSLLALRVFGHPKRSETLLDEIGLNWRYGGPVQFVAGEDIAAAYLRPEELLDFVMGRLSRHFVQTAADVGRKLRGRDLLPDPDGRYRVNSFFCTDATWRATVAELVVDSEAILMDARSFTADNRGVQQELDLVVSLSASDRVALLVDGTTDLKLMSRMLGREESSDEIASPLRALRVDRASSREVEGLLSLLEVES